MSSSEKSSPAKMYLIVVIGLAMAIGGYWFSVNVHLEIIQKLNDQGIPLDLGKTISMIGMFLLLFPVLKFFYFKPLGDAITERTTELEKTFSEAEQLRDEMTQLKTDYEKRLAETEARAREAIQAQIREAQNLRTELMSEAGKKADELLKKAAEEIALEKDRVIAQLRVEVVNMTLSATEKILGENLDDAKNRKLIEEFIAKAEVPS